MTPPPTPLIAAHRGASKAEPENTIAAFLAARRLGADMVELDVRRTNDDHLVVHHDAAIGETPIIDMRADELPSSVPSLAEALHACEGMQVNVEIKSDPKEPDYDASQPSAAAVVDLLLATRDIERIIVSSFDRDAIDAVHRLAPEVRTGFLFMVPLPDVDTLFDDLAASGHVAVHPNRHAVTAGLVAAAHARGLAVNVWTVDKPDEMATLAALGVDAIITNVPDLAVATLRP